MPTSLGICYGWFLHKLCRSFSTDCMDIILDQTTCIVQNKLFTKQHKTQNVVINNKYKIFQ